MKRLSFALVAAVVIAVTACTAVPAAEQTPTPTTSLHVEMQTPTAEPVRAAPRVTPTPETTAEHTAEEGAYLASVYDALGPDAGWWEYAPSDPEDGARQWLDMGYAVCGLYEAGWTDAEVVDFLAPNYVNSRLYPEGFAEALAESARGLCEA